MGTTQEQTFTEVLDSAATAQGTATICGNRKYEVLDSASIVSTLVTVVNLGAGNYKVVATSSNELFEGEHDLTLRVTFVNYPLATSPLYPKA